MKKKNNSHRGFNLLQKPVSSKINFVSGFTLIEIMIVISVLAILTTLAIPNILRSHIAARESLALTNIKKISESCQIYYTRQDSYPAALADLSGDIPPYLDSTLTSGTKDGYNFIYTQTADGFTVQANVAAGGLGRHFYTDETDIIRVHVNAPAGPGDPGIN